MSELAIICNTLIEILRTPPQEARGFGRGQWEAERTIIINKLLDGFDYALRNH